MLQLDPNDPVIRLCVDGMMAEGDGRPADAAELFGRAWQSRRDDVDAAIAAHYVARHQTTAEGTLAWNQRALEHALLVQGAEADRVLDLLPSLWLNVGKSLEDFGRCDEACLAYEAGSASCGGGDDDGHATMIRRGLAAGLTRILQRQDPAS